MSNAARQPNVPPLGAAVWTSFWPNEPKLDQWRVVELERPALLMSETRFRDRLHPAPSTPETRALRPAEQKFARAAASRRCASAARPTAASPRRRRERTPPRGRSRQP